MRVKTLTRTDGQKDFLYPKLTLISCDTEKVWTTNMKWLEEVSQADLSRAGIWSLHMTVALLKRLNSTQCIKNSLGLFKPWDFPVSACWATVLLMLICSDCHKPEECRTSALQRPSCGPADVKVLSLQCPKTRSFSGIQHFGQPLLS